MARTPLLSLRIDAEAKTRWEAAAAERGVPLSEFVRSCVEFAINPNAAVASSSQVRSIHTGGKRTYQPDPK